MKLYNTLSRQKEDFVPITPGEVKMYACGPTVYNFIHIGNARPICVFDTLRRYLEYKGYRVQFAQNYTDIDDKLINRANEEGVTVPEIAQRFIAAYEVDTKGLGIRPASIHPKATDNIDTIQDMISMLVDKGFAYPKNGSVYFRSRAFPRYGRLSHQPLEELESGARIDVSEDKDDALDFVLWKAAKPGEPFWPSPWGDGRPGWHIECSAMTRRHLGDTIDIHCGGQDLIFPHHENEIAQSECCTGQTYVRYWLHNGYINVDNRKMSKSLGNFFTVRDIASEYGYEPIKFLMLQAHYRSPIQFSREAILQCRSALERLHTCRDHLHFLLENAADVSTPDRDANFLSSVHSRRDQFEAAMDDDLNTADAIGALFSLVRDVNTYTTASVSHDALRQAIDLFDCICGVLGLLYDRSSAKTDSQGDALIAELVSQRQAARQAKNWAAADAIRDRLAAMGITIKDTPQGPQILRSPSSKVQKES